MLKKLVSPKLIAVMATVLSICALVALSALIWEGYTEKNFLSFAKIFSITTTSALVVLPVLFLYTGGHHSMAEEITANDEFK